MESNKMDIIWLVLLIGIGTIGGVMSLLANLTPLDVPDASLIWVLGCAFIPVYILVNKILFFKYHFLIGLFVAFVLSVFVVAIIVVPAGNVGGTLGALLVIGVTIIAYIVEILYFFRKISNAKNSSKDNVTTN